MTPNGTPPAGGEVGGIDVVTYNHDVELALIGTVLTAGPNAFPALAEVTVDDFSPTYAELWDAVATIAQVHGVRPDLTLIRDHLGPRRTDTLGGPHALQQLLIDAQATGPAPTAASRHITILRSTAHARRLQTTAVELAFNATTDRVNDLVDQLDAIRRDTSHHRVRLTTATTIEPGRPNWIWNQRIPVGGVTLMAGREGEGKTLLVCWLAARISRGQLDGERRHDPADVVYIGLEDDRSTVIIPRLIAAGADLDRFHFVDVANDIVFTLEADLADLTTALAHRNVGLVVLDPLDAHLGTIDSYKKAEVQAAIGRLAHLTQELRCGALGLAHFNKAGVTELLARINGSKAFATAVRSVLAVGTHPDNENDRLCVLAKANMTSKLDVPALRFRIEGTTIPPTDDGPDITTARVTILGEETGHHPDQLLATPTGEERNLTDEATDWLQDVLADGPVARAEIITLATTEGFTDKVLRRARERLGIIADRDTGTRGRPSAWKLP